MKRNATFAFTDGRMARLSEALRVVGADKLKTLPIEVKAILKSFTENKRFVVLHGQAGTGKSHTIRTLVQSLSECDFKISVVAPTGIATCNLNNEGIAARTIHSKFAISPYKTEVAAIKFYHRSNASKIDLLIVDELSMVNSLVFDYIANVVNGWNSLFVLVTGDHLQIPPISLKFAFEASTWPQNATHLYLRHVYRQTDENYSALLQRIRKCDFTVASKFDCRVLPAPDDATRLFSYNQKVDEYNKERLAAIASPWITFDAVISMAPAVKGIPVSAADRKKIIELQQDESRIGKLIPVGLHIQAKVGAVVMVRKNGVVGECVNGSTGTLIGDAVAGHSVIYKGRIFPLPVLDFVIPVGETANLIVKQVPISVAFATSIHKCQGLSMDKACVDPCTFGPGMLYVVLSRIITMGGLFLTRKLPSSWPAYSDKAIKFEEDTRMVYLLMKLRKHRNCDVGNMALEIASYI